MDVDIYAAVLIRVAEIDHGSGKLERRVRNTHHTCEVCSVLDTPSLNAATFTSPSEERAP